MLRYLLALSALLMLLAACGPAEVPENEATQPATTATVADNGDEADVTTGEEAPAEVVDAGPPPEFADADYEATESGLQVAVIEEGDGEAPEEGDIVLVHYTGKLGDGAIFDSSEGRDPIRFTLGGGRVIDGWEEGIALLNKGDRALLVIPPELGYGEAGTGGIPPNATLYFEVELVDILEGGPAAPLDVAEDDYETTDSGLQVYVVEEGEGDPPAEGQPVRVDFTAWFTDGARLDSTIDQGQPLVFALGTEQLFPGLSEAVSTMRVGGQSQFIIPADLAFGEQGTGGIPPNSDLIFLIDLLELLPPAPAEPVEVGEDDYVVDDAGFQIADVEEGSGDPAAAGDVAEFHVTGWLQEDGSKILSSYDQGEPIQLPIGSGQALPGWDAGLTGMREGGVRQVIVSPELGFGEAGAGDVVPPNATLIWLIELISLNADAE
jgi:peptidylprolyl isomerase